VSEAGFGSGLPKKGKKTGPNRTSKHYLRQLPIWDAKENQIPCLEHAVQLAVVSVMDHITKRAVADTAAAIWDYDPSLESNKVAGGRPDVLSVLRTVDVKVSLISRSIIY
jgi:hypothetical protein